MLLLVISHHHIGLMTQLHNTLKVAKHEDSLGMGVMLKHAGFCKYVKMVETWVTTKGTLYCHFLGPP